MRGDENSAYRNLHWGLNYPGPPLTPDEDITRVADFIADKIIEENATRSCGRDLFKDARCSSTASVEIAAAARLRRLSDADSDSSHRRDAKLMLLWPRTS